MMRLRDPEDGAEIRVAVSGRYQGWPGWCLMGVSLRSRGPLVAMWRGEHYVEESLDNNFGVDRYGVVSQAVVVVEPVCGHTFIAQDDPGYIRVKDCCTATLQQVFSQADTLVGV